MGKISATDGPSSNRPDTEEEIAAALAAEAAALVPEPEPEPATRPSAPKAPKPKAT